jgi:hypothetical protein
VERHVNKPMRQHASRPGAENPEWAATEIRQARPLLAVVPKDYWNGAGASPDGLASSAQLQQIDRLSPAADNRSSIGEFSPHSCGVVSFRECHLITVWDNRSGRLAFRKQRLG